MKYIHQTIYHFFQINFCLIEKIALIGEFNDI